MSDFSIKDARDFAPEGLSKAQTWGQLYEAILDVVQESNIFAPFDDARTFLSRLRGESLNTLADELDAVFYSPAWSLTARINVLESYLNNPDRAGSADWLQNIVRSVGGDASFILDSRTYTKSDVALYEIMRESAAEVLGTSDWRTRFVCVLDVISSTPIEDYLYVIKHLKDVYNWRLFAFIFAVNGNKEMFIGAAGVDSAIFVPNDELCEMPYNGYLYDCQTDSLTSCLYDDGNETVEAL